MKTTNPALSNDVGFFPGTRLRWGLGHMINLDPASGIAGVIMMQVLPFADQRALGVYRGFEHGINRAYRPV